MGRSVYLAAAAAMAAPIVCASCGPLRPVQSDAGAGPQPDLAPMLDAWQASVDQVDTPSADAADALAPMGGSCTILLIPGVGCPDGFHCVPSDPRSLDGSGTCQLDLRREGQHCEGFLRDPPHCAAGYDCAPDPMLSGPFGDVGGICLSAVPSCGGSLPACLANATCVQQSAADAHGVCLPTCPPPFPAPSPCDGALPAYSCITTAGITWACRCEAGGATGTTQWVCRR